MYSDVYYYVRIESWFQIKLIWGYLDFNMLFYVMRCLSYIKRIGFLRIYDILYDLFRFQERRVDFRFEFIIQQYIFDLYVQDNFNLKNWNEYLRRIWKDIVL